MLGLNRYCFLDDITYNLFKRELPFVVQTDPPSATLSATRPQSPERPSGFALYRLNGIASNHDQTGVFRVYTHGLVESATLADIQPSMLLPSREDAFWAKSEIGK